MANSSELPQTWDTALPLFSRRMMGQWTGAMLATGTVMALLLGTIFAANREWDTLPSMLGMIGAACAGLWLFGFAIMAIVFRGQYGVRFILSDEGIRCETIDKAAQFVNRAAIVGGVLGRSMSTTGSGLISASRETEEVHWTGTFTASFDPDRQCITLRNAWRTLMWVQCTPENYAPVAAAIREQMDLHKTAVRVKGPSPVPKYLGRTALVIAACVPLFPLAEEFDTGTLLPILILCFALATVWLINLFGWVVLAGLVLQAALVVGSQFEVRRSMFRPGQTYRAYEVLGGDDISLMLVAALGAGILVWQAAGALRGRWLAALLEGYKDMG